MSEVNLLFTPRQTEALDIMSDPKVKEVLYGGAKGGGKSVFFVQWCYLRCQELIRFFKIPNKPATILPVGFMGRKRGVDFTKTTLETWKKIIPSGLYRIRPADKEIIVDERVKMYYGGMDDESSVNKMNSAEFAFIAIDQAEELGIDDLGLLKGTLRLRMPGLVPDYKVLLTANPAPCFLKEHFIDSPPKDGSKVFIQALPTDNPFLDKAYIDTLHDAFKHRPELIRAYVYGSWDDIEGLDILIKHSWVSACINHEKKVQHDVRVTSADVARYGIDETVIYNLIDNRVVGEKIYGMKPADQTAGQILKMAVDNKSDIITIDGDGFGGGVIDFVRSLLKDRGDGKLKVLEINSGKKASNDKKYVNARTEMWFYAADLFAEQECGVPDDHLLIMDLTSVKYNTVENGRFKCEPKKDVRKRISRSPDRADALIYGLWASQFVRKKIYDFKRQQPSPVPQRDSYGWGNHNRRGIVASGRTSYGW